MYQICISMQTTSCFSRSTLVFLILFGILACLFNLFLLQAPLIYLSYHNLLLLSTSSLSSPPGHFSSFYGREMCLLFEVLSDWFLLEKKRKRKKKKNSKHSITSHSMHLETPNNTSPLHLPKHSSKYFHHQEKWNRR